MEYSDDHIYLIGAYIDALSLQYSLLNVTTGNEFVRDFKRKTNQYLEYLENKMYSIFIEKYGLEEEFVNDQFDKMRVRSEFQKEQFLLDMCKA